jgi:PAS domain S-box-containing protein
MGQDDETKEERLGSKLQEALSRISEFEGLESQCRLAEDRVAQQEDFLNRVLESLTHPFYVLDASDYTIKLANTAARLGDLSGKPTCYGVTHRRAAPCDGVEHTCPLQEVKKTGKPVTVEHVHYDKKGNARHVEVNAYPIFDAQGNVFRIIEYVLDITERKKLEKEMQSYAEKIKLFAYSISHDLKNPIIAINGLTRRLCKPQSEMLDGNARAHCEQILRASQQALSLIDEINLFIKTKEAPLNLELFRPREIIGQVRDEFSISLADRHINWSDPQQIPEVKADKMSALRAFRNLVDNALKYGGENLGEIRIGYEESPDFHTFSVYDDGVGVDRESAEKIFETFQRSEKSRGVDGAGLGLAIVREIAEKHGGKAWVENGHDKGVTFYISISSHL